MHVQKFVSEALSCQHLDVVYVYNKLESEKVFFYTAMPKQVREPIYQPLVLKTHMSLYWNTLAVKKNEPFYAVITNMHQKCTV